MASTSTIYVASCPICHDGLARIRFCGLREKSMHGFVICDECEAAWLRPDLDVQPPPLDPETPRCPICKESIWTENSRWASEEDVCLLGWYPYVCVDRQTD